MNTKRCYILGAGFSKACGLPLARELTAEVCGYWRDEEESRVDDPAPYPTKQQRDLLRDLFPHCDLKQRWPDFEKLLTVLDEWDDYHRACGNDGDQFVRDFRAGLVKGLLSLLSERVDVARRANRLRAVKDFLKRVHDEQSTIVSFNWDLLLEVAAQDTGLGITYRKQKIKNAVCVAKPHGSLNLAELSKSDYEEKKRRGTLFGMDIEPQSKDTNTLILRDPDPTANRRVAERWGPLVIAPTVKKSYGSPWINGQWHLALDMVRNAQEVVIIGYSLPPTDIRPRLLLQFARFRRDAIIRFIDPSKKIDKLRRRIEKVVGKPVNIINKPWEKDVLSS